MFQLLLSSRPAAGWRHQITIQYNSEWNGLVSYHGLAPTDNYHSTPFYFDEFEHHC